LAIHLQRYKPTTATLEYNPETDNWTKKSDMPTGRIKFSTATLNDELYVIAGAKMSGKLAIIEKYDPELDTWVRKSDMPNARSGVGIGVINDKIYLIGGVNMNFDKINLVEEYQPLLDI
jgi:N-acetylneuraminic acid mutarotase